MKKYTILIVFAVCVLFLGTGRAAAVDKGSKPVAKTFQGGEKLTYLASYKIGMVYFDVVNVFLSTTVEQLDGREMFRINGLAVTRPTYDWFFGLYDDYYVWVDPQTLQPHLFKNFIKEGDYRYKSVYKYDWKNMKVHTAERRASWDRDSVRSFPVVPQSYDALSLFYNLREIDFGKLNPGASDTLDVVFANRVRRVAYRFEGREEHRFTGMGKQKCLKFVCQLANNSGVSFQDGSEFTIWISDDGNKIPLYVETPIRVGSVRVRLVETEGLRYPKDYFK